VIDGDEKLALKGLLEAKRRELERQIKLQSEASDSPRTIKSSPMAAESRVGRV
jgi:hypothetical protein